jgi:RNA polymerase sigma factor (sigma-70 family)
MQTVIELLSDEYPTLRTKVVLYLERRGCYEAEEVADEAISRLPGAMLRARRPVPLGAMLFAIAKRAHLEWIRQRQRSHECAREFQRRLSLAEKTLDIDVAAEVSRLGGLDREIALRHYWQDETLDSIARTLGMQAGAVRARIYRIRKRLRLEIARRHPELVAA